MQNTTNYLLKKPEPLTDYVNVSDLNENADIIDAKLKENADATINLAGAGRTTETVKGNTDALAAHQAKKATGTTLGHVMVDGDTIIIDENGVISLSDPLVLSNVLNFNGINAAQAVYLSWNNPVSDDFLGIVLFRSTQDISNSTYEYCVANATQLANGTVTSYDDVDLSPGTYHYRVFAKYNVFGQEKYSEGLGMVANALVWDGYYYNLGEEYSSITGGWVENNQSAEIGEGGGTKSKNADHLYMNPSGSYSNSQSYVCNDLIDLSNVSTLYIDWEQSNSGGTPYVYLNIDDTIKMGSYANKDAQIVHQNSFSRTVQSLDVSALTGSYYIRVHGRSSIAGTTTVTETLKVYKIWGEA